jgi:phage tail-like protein
MNAFQKREFNPADVYISLLNDKHTAIKTWHLHKAWPRKWSISDMNASENAIVVETMDLSYTHFTVK